MKETVKFSFLEFLLILSAVQVVYSVPTPVHINIVELWINDGYVSMWTDYPYTTLA